MAARHVRGEQDVAELKQEIKVAKAAAAQVANHERRVTRLEAA